MCVCGGGGYVCVCRCVCVCVCVCACIVFVGVRVCNLPCIMKIDFPNTFKTVDFSGVSGSENRIGFAIKFPAEFLGNSGYGAVSNN